MILGHSERRQYFGETDATVNLKLKAAIRHGLTPIVCGIGESLAQNEAGETVPFMELIRGAFAGNWPARRWQSCPGLRTHLGHRDWPHGDARGCRSHYP